ncbi:hypothetical protein D3C84_851540 [compost metagenome]
MGYRQPGRKHGVELAGGDPLPHDAGGHGLQFDVIAEFLPDDFGGDVGGRHTVGPAIDIADAHFLGQRVPRANGHYQGGAHPQESSHFHPSIPSSRHGSCIINRAWSLTCSGNDLKATRNDITSPARQIVTSSNTHPG